MRSKNTFNFLFSVRFARSASQNYSDFCQNMPKYLKVELAVKTGSLFFLDFSRHEGTLEIQKEVKINSERAENSPFFIRRIQKESSAFSKGVRNGDRIIKLNDFEIKGLCFLSNFFDFFRK